MKYAGRRREQATVQDLLRRRRPFVVDNTNATAADRARYVGPAPAAGFRVVCFFLEVTPRQAIGRQKGGPERERIGVPAILATHSRLEAPRHEEGFDAVYRVHSERGRFLVEASG